MLRIAPGLDLPVDYVTKATAIFAQRRKGKTYTANVIAEELVDHDLPWAALDPTGAWWGLRASSDGQRDGLPVTIFGGHHGDAPLGRSDGRVIGNLVVDHPGWYILDLSLIDTRAGEREFAADFAETLYRRKGQEGSDFPLHLFVDEADMFVPQDKETGDQRMLGAFQSIVRRGGLRGLGTTLISQRPALVNKSVLVQLDLLVVLRLVAGNDQDYVKKNYLERAGTKEQVAELMDSWAGLKLGEAWLWEPGAEPPLFARAQVRERRTFNSSATPKVGEKRVEPKRLAPVDLDAVKDAMAEAIARAEADDPKVLRRRIGELERTVRELEATQPAPEPEEIKVPLLDEQLVARLEEVVAGVSHIGHELATSAAAIEGQISTAKSMVSSPPDNRWKAPTSPASHPVQPGETTRRAPAVRGTAEHRSDADGRLGKRERAILSVLVQYGPRTHRQLALQTGYSAKASTIGAGLSALRKLGYVSLGQPVAATQEGVDALGDYEPLPSGPALLAYWRNELGGRERALLNVLVERYPDTVSHEEMCAATGYSPDASTVGAGMSKLRALELADGWRASDDFMEAIR